MIVMKFGGTSVESAAAIERVAGIVKAREQRRPVVVVSAMGKTTNKLLAIAQAAIQGRREEYIRQLHDLRDFHSREARQVASLAERVELDRFLDEQLERLKTDHIDFYLLHALSDARWKGVLEAGVLERAEAAVLGEAAWVQAREQGTAVRPIARECGQRPRRRHNPPQLEPRLVRRRGARHEEKNESDRNCGERSEHHRSILMSSDKQER